MSFSTRMKDDLARVVSSKSCCRRAEFLAFFLINGNIRIGKGLSLVMNTEHSAAARKMYTLARDFDLEREVSVFRRSRLKKNAVYTLEIPPQENMQAFLAELGLVDEQVSWRFDFTDAARERFLTSGCCRRAYLRGAFLAAGSVTDPETGSYHLEIDGLESAQAALIIDLLAGFGLKAKTVTRRDSQTVYLKGAEQVSDFMNIVGAHRALLQLESLRVTRDVRNRSNRQRNCDTANLNKAVAAAVRQVADIQFIIEQIGFETLPQNLRTAAELRLDNQDANLSELSELSGLGRSALNHRLRRLTEIAENIRVYGPEEWDKD
ncbi:MAG: DNA-binding protein WhiA [Firmicutes bacterium]|nr:DNA-binding protein WhiA [Bacillota bacterium]